MHSCTDPLPTPTNRAELRELLAMRGLAPKKSLGQNFMVEPLLIDRLLVAAGVGPGDLVLEIGPGAGALTGAALRTGARVVACELDDGLADLLAETLVPAYPDTFTLLRDDCLAAGRRVNPAIVQALGRASFVVVSNLPYGAGTPFIASTLCDLPGCCGLYVTVQRELGDRLLAAHGTKAYGELSVLTQALAVVRKLCDAPPGCFWPEPKVTSSLLAIERRSAPLTSDPRRLAATCQRLFQQRRKQLGSVLGRDIPLPDGISANDRPGALSVAQLVALDAALPHSWA